MEIVSCELCVNYIVFDYQVSNQDNINLIWSTINFQGWVLDCL